MIRFPFLPFAAFAVLAACGGDPVSRRTAAQDALGGGTGIVAGTLQVTVTANQTLVLKNQTGFPVGYLVIEANQYIIAKVPPCGGEGCTKLVQGEEVTIPYLQIRGYSVGAREAIVHWWTYVVPGPDREPVVNHMASTRVRL